MQRWLVTFIIYLTGVRFYQTFNHPTESVRLRSVFKTIRGQDIEFMFFREVYADREYHFGKIQDVNSHAIIIQACFGNDIDLPIMKFNGSRFLFENRFFKFFNDEILAKILLGIYLDNIGDQL